MDIRKNIVNFSVVVFLVLIAVIYWTLGAKSSYLYGMTADSAIYLLLADEFSLFNAEALGAYDFLMDRYPFPPFFPLLISVFGGGTESPLLSHALVIAMLLAAVGVYYLWLKSEEVSDVASLSLAVVFALFPVTIKQMTVIQSEHLYVLLTMLGLLFLNWSRHDRKLLYLSAAAFGLSAITRSIGVIGIAVFLFDVLRRRAVDKTRVVLLFIISALPILTWSIYKKINFSGKSYAQIFTDTMGGDVFTSLYQQVVLNVKLIWLYTVNALDPGLSLYVQIAIGAAGLLAVIGVFIGVSKLRPWAIYLMGYLLVIVAWPYSAQLERFLFVIIPLLLFSCAYAVSFVSISHTQFRNTVHLSVAAILVLLMLPAWGGIWTRYEYAVSSSLGDLAKTPDWLFSTNPESVINSARSMDKIYKSMRNTEAYVSSDECVISTAPAYYMLHAGRMSKKPAHHDSDDNSFNEGVKPCRYVFMMSVIPKPSVGNPAMYPFHRIKDDMGVIDVTYFNETDKQVASMLVEYPRAE